VGTPGIGSAKHLFNLHSKQDTGPDQATEREKKFVVSDNGFKPYEVEVDASSEWGTAAKEWREQ